MARTYPDRARWLEVGSSRGGRPIVGLRAGHGPHQALWVAFPHPNEPVGGLTCLALAELAASGALERLPFTWTLIPCADPDGAFLNGDWFGGPFTLDAYSRRYYRPPDPEQIEFGYPVEYKTLSFDGTPPETRALMGLIEGLRPALLCVLHNATLSGGYYYLGCGDRDLQGRLLELMAGQGVPLHDGEPEMPWVERLAGPCFRWPTIEETYDGIAFMGGQDPARVYRGGASSFDYARRSGEPAFLIPEVPLFTSQRLADPGPAGTGRRRAAREGLEAVRRDLERMQGLWAEADLDGQDPLARSVAYRLETMPHSLEGTRRWLEESAELEGEASVAQALDWGPVSRFYLTGLTAAMLARAVAGQAELLSGAEALRREVVAEVEAALRPTSPPIASLVRVQLGAGLLAAERVAQRAIEADC